MILHGLEEIKTLQGYGLWKVMKSAEKSGLKNVFNACYERAKELNHREYGSWEEAKKRFNVQVFPKWERETKTLTARLLGFYTEVHQEVDEAMNIKNQYMALINQKTNSCVLRWFVRNGEVSFS